MAISRLLVEMITEKRHQLDRRGNVLLLSELEGTQIPKGIASD
jgi:hypothetical protein